MKRLLVGLLLLAQVAWSQVTQLPDQIIYRGADYSLSLLLTKADSSLSSAAFLYVGPNGTLVKPPLQPAAQRVGRSLNLVWSAAQTGELADGKYWLEIKAGNSVRFAAWVIAGKTPTNTTPANSLTVVSPIAAPLTELPPYRLNGVSPSGFRINHNRGTPLIKATFYREDTGRSDRYRPDGLWSIAIISDNTIEVTGPPGELFSGYLQLEPIPISNQ